MPTQYCLNTECGGSEFAAYGEDGNVHCTTCGTIHEGQTSYRNLVDTVAGHTVYPGYTGQGFAGNVKDSRSATAEAKFKEVVKLKAITWLFEQPNILGLDTNNNLLGERGTENKFVHAVYRIYNTIRHADAGVRKLEEDTINAETRRINYQLAVAIRQAAMQNNLILAYNGLKDAQYAVTDKVTDKVTGEITEVTTWHPSVGFKPVAADTFPASLEGVRPTVSEYLPVPLPMDLVSNLTPVNSAAAAAENPISERKYLLRTQTLAIRALKLPNDPFYIVLSNIGLCIQRFRELVHPTKPGGRKLYFDKEDSKTWQKLEEKDFEHFKSANLQESNPNHWREVMETAVNLYRAGQAVSLWNLCTSYPFAVALVYTAVVGQIKEEHPHPSSVLAELCAQYGTAAWTAIPAVNSLKRQIIAWTSSFPDITISASDLPMLEGKTTSGARVPLGTGNAGYRGSKIRPIPAGKLWAVAIKPVASHWRDLCVARSKRLEVTPFDEELAISRELLAEWSKPKGKIRCPRGTGPGAMARIPATKVDQSEGESGSETAGKAVKKVVEDPDTLFKAGPEIQTRAPHSHWHPTVTIPTVTDPAVTNPIVTVPIVTVPAVPVKRKRGVAPTMTPQQIAGYEALEASEQTIPESIGEMMMRQDSSDEEDGFSSDDEPTSKRRCMPKEMKGKENGGFTPFTIGLQCFNMEKNDSEKEDTLYHNYDVPSQSETSESSASEAGRNRGISPAGSSSTLHSLSSTYGRGEPMSRTPSYENDAHGQVIPTLRPRKSDWVPRPTRPVQEMRSDKSHIAVLARERDEYVVCSTKSLRASGRLVSAVIEEYINTWLLKEQAEARMPKKITRAYLRSIGLDGINPTRDRLSDWILSQEWRWSPLECVLRAGIKPRNLPLWMIPQSLLAVRRLLEHLPELSYIDIIPECPAIPQEYKDDPVKYSKEINQLKSDYEKSASSDDFPYYFKADQRLVLIPEEADTLFEDWEWGWHFLPAKEVRKRRKNQAFMDLITPSKEVLAEKEQRQEKAGMDTDGKAKKRYTEFVPDMTGDSQLDLSARALEDEAYWEGVGLGEAIYRAGAGVEGYEEGEDKEDEDYHKHKSKATVKRPTTRKSEVLKEDSESDSESDDSENDSEDDSEEESEGGDKSPRKQKRAKTVKETDGEESEGSKASEASNTPLAQPRAKRQADAMEAAEESQGPKRTKIMGEFKGVIAESSKVVKPLRRAPVKAIKEIVAGGDNEVVGSTTKKRKATEEEVTAAPKKQKTTPSVKGGKSVPVLPDSEIMANFMKQTCSVVNNNDTKTKVDEDTESGVLPGPTSTQPIQPKVLSAREKMYRFKAKLPMQPRPPMTALKSSKPGLPA